MYKLAYALLRITLLYLNEGKFDVNCLNSTSKKKHSVRN